MRWPSWPFGKGFSHITTHTHNFKTSIQHAAFHSHYQRQERSRRSLSRQ